MLLVTRHIFLDILGYRRNISCDFSINDCDWTTSFHVLNSVTSSPLVDYNTNSTNSGIIAIAIQCVINGIGWAGGYVFIRGNQIIGGSKIFLTLDSITISVINEIIFVYQLNSSVSLTLQTSSHDIWSSNTNPGAATRVGNWWQVRLYARSLPISDLPVNLQFLVTGSSNGFAAVDDLTIQVKSHCNYEALSDPG